MKKFCLVSLLCFISFGVQGQSFDFKIDHFAIVVDDVDTSAEFYGNILRLTETPHPDKTPGFRWFIVSGSSQIHLIQKGIRTF